jgi:hypothetical protein
VSNNQTGAITLSTSQFTELEYAIVSTNLAQIGTTYCFRVTNAGDTTNFSYSVSPQIVLTGRPRPQTGGSGVESIPTGAVQGGGDQSGGATTTGEESGSGPVIPGGGQGGGGGDLGLATPPERKGFFARIAALFDRTIDRAQVLAAAFLAF